MPVTGRYLADLPLDADALEVVFVRSPFAHAAIRSIQGAGAAAQDLNLQPLSIEGDGLCPKPWHPLPVDRARYPGEPLAAVWAADRHQAEDRAEAVTMDLEPLPPEPPAILFERLYEAGDQEAWSRVTHVLEATWRSARQSALPLETRGVVARWDANAKRIELWTSTQVPHLVRTGVAAALRLPEEAIRVRVPDVGGGFGLKAHVFAEEIVLAALARQQERTLRWVEDRTENLMGGAHAHDTEIALRVAVDRDGRVLAVEADVTADVGAYSIYPLSASLEPMTAASTLFGPYAIEAIKYRARALSSHRCPVGAYRGVGMNAAVYATERMLDEVAAHLDQDPLVIRRRNLLRDLPRATLTGRRLDSGDYAALLDRLEETTAYSSASVSASSTSTAAPAPPTIGAGASRASPAPTPPGCASSRVAACSSTPAPPTPARATPKPIAAWPCASSGCGRSRSTSSRATRTSARPVRAPSPAGAPWG
jgi:carbon-monoxide dehydrogenase large subunit